jgi:hypothetical protein
VKKYLIPLGAGVVVFGAVTAFAATLNVSSTSLAAGNALVTSCNDNAAVSYANVANGTAFKVGTTTVTTSGAQSPGCGSMTFQVTLTGASGALASKTGTLASNGTGTVDFSTGTAVDPHDVTGVSVVITG